MNLDGVIGRLGIIIQLPFENKSKTSSEYRKLGANLLKREKSLKAGRQTKRFKAAWDHDDLLNILGCGKRYRNQDRNERDFYMRLPWFGQPLGLTPPLY